MVTREDVEAAFLSFSKVSFSNIGNSTLKNTDETMNTLSVLIPHRVKLFLLANRDTQGFAFELAGAIFYVLLEIKYQAYMPTRGSTVQLGGKVYLWGPKDKRMIQVSKRIEIYYDIPIDTEYHPVGYKYKTSPRYKKRHTTIIAFPVFKGFGGVIERKSGGTQEVRMTFSIPAKLRMQFGRRKLAFSTNFYWISTIDKNKLSDSYSRGSAIGFTTDLINSKDKPTHWGVVINGESRAPFKVK